MVVYDMIQGYYLFECECDNTHVQHNTVCRYCYAIQNPECGDYVVMTKEEYLRVLAVKKNKFEVK